MDSPGYILLSRLALQSRATQVLANNIANADTPGFRAQHPLFAAHLHRLGAMPVPGGSTAAYVQDRATWRERRPGAVQTTSNPLDIALGADGYLAVETPRGERYARAGRLSLAPDGRIVDLEGHAVLGTTGTPIAVAAGDTRIEILGDGTVRSENGVLGRLRVVRFDRPDRLLAEGNRLFHPDGEEPRPVEQPQITQGAFEGSNVSAVVEITRLTAEMREFQLAVQFADRESERITTAIERILRRRGA
ncbi:MAG TPA: flagellar hook basal-body protein [Acetobacteraceae bacterium]|nr:flagellar hook basal-body protein [Acetobacteraceae bacterium]